jgi:hypothetical protein
MLRLFLRIAKQESTHAIVQDEKQISYMNHPTSNSDNDLKLWRKQMRTCQFDCRHSSSGLQASGDRSAGVRQELPIIDFPDFILQYNSLGDFCSNQASLTVWALETHPGPLDKFRTKTKSRVRAGRTLKRAGRAFLPQLGTGRSWMKLEQRETR